MRTTEINNKNQITVPGRLENTKQSLYQISTPRYVIFKLQKLQYKEKNIEKSQKEENVLSIEARLLVSNHASKELMPKIFKVLKDTRRKSTEFYIK